MVCALLERVRSGKGQVVDAAMVDGAATLMTIFHAAQQSGWWSEERGTNMLDSGAHFYDVYETADGKYVSIGSIEPQFYAELLERTGLDAAELAGADRSRALARAAERLRGVFKTQDARRVVRDHGGQRRLLRAGAVDLGGAPRTRTTSRAARSSRSRASSSRARAALQPHRLGHPAAARARGRAHRRGARGLGLRRGRDRARCASAKAIG